MRHANEEKLMAKHGEKAIVDINFEGAKISNLLDEDFKSAI